MKSILFSSIHNAHTYHVNGDLADFGVSMFLAECLDRFDFLRNLFGQHILQATAIRTNIADRCGEQRQSFLKDKKCV